MILLSLSFVIHWVREEFHVGMLILVGAAWIVFLGTQWQQRRQLHKAFEKHQDLLVNQHIKLTLEEIVQSSDVAVGATRWEAIRQVRETDTHAFIFTTDTSAIVVPCRAFSDQRAFREFVDTAKTYHARALESRRDKPG